MRDFLLKITPICRTFRTFVTNSASAAGQPIGETSQCITPKNKQKQETDSTHDTGSAAVAQRGTPKRETGQAKQTINNDEIARHPSNRTYHIT